MLYTEAGLGGGTKKKRGKQAKVGAHRAAKHGFV